MSVAKNKPKPTYETCLIVNFGMHFLALDAAATVEELFKAFVQAFPLVGHFSDKMGINYGLKKNDSSVSHNDIFWLRKAGELSLENKNVKYLKHELERYKNDSFTEAYLRETLRYLKAMVYSATVAPSDQVNDLSEWIRDFVPFYRFEKSFWTAPGNTSLSGNPIFYWYGDEKVSEEEKQMLEIFGVFRGKFIETLGKSLDTRSSSEVAIRMSKISTRIEQLKPNEEPAQGRKWSNGEFYFAACRCCGAIFRKDRNFDKQFCSKKECVDKFASRIARRFGAFQKACENEDLKKMSILLGDRLFVGAQDKNGLTPLMYSVKFCGSLAAVELCLKAKVPFRVLDFDRMSVLWHSISSKIPLDALERLLCFCQKEFFRLVMCDAFLRAAEIYPLAIKLLIVRAKKNDTKDRDLRLMIDSCDKESETGLIKLCRSSGNAQIIKLLVESGADLKKKNKKGKNAYYYASKNDALRGTSLLEELRKGQYARLNTI